MSDNDFDQPPIPQGRNGPSVFLILLIVVATISAFFIAQNRDRVEVQFLFFSFNGRTWTTILIAIALGILLDRLVLAWWRRTRRKKNDA